MASENKTGTNGATAEMEVEEDYMEILERNKENLLSLGVGVRLGAGDPPAGVLLAVVEAALRRRDALEEAVARFCSGLDKEDEDDGGDDRKEAGESTDSGGRGGDSDSELTGLDEESSRGSTEIGDGREN